MTPIEQAAQALREAIIPCLKRLQPTEHALAPTLYEQMAAHNALNIARAALASLEAAKQEPLTDEQLLSLAREHVSPYLAGLHPKWFVDFGRAVLAAASCPGG